MIINNSTSNIFNENFTKNYTIDKQDILSLNITNFSVFLEKNPISTRNINSVVASQTSQFFNYVNHTLFKDALWAYNSKIAGGTINFNGYGASLLSTLTYNEKCTLSYYTDEYEYSGGAHGITTRTSKTFSLENGKVLPLSYFIGTTNYKHIVDEIISQADVASGDTDGIYFENYHGLIKQNFNPNNYYLTTKGIVFYFQVYEIAPSALQTPTFIIDYKHFKNSPSCRMR